MFVATILCNPARPSVDPALMASLRNAWGGGDVIWLMPDVAAEFALRDQPNNMAEVSQELSALNLDLVVQPMENRRKRVLLADMDSTMIEQECIDELADEAGVGGRVAEITARAMNGELEFEEALRERVGLLKGLNLGVIETVLSNRITYMPGGKTLVATMGKNGGYAALVSGGFTVFTGPVAQHLGFDEHRSNTFEMLGGKLTGSVIPPIFGRDAKVEALDEITARLGLLDEDVLAVGDGANDLGMLHRAGLGVALHAKPAVQAQADIRINHGDLTALLFLQGYCASDFA